jgi:hypothetical protein
MTLNNNELKANLYAYKEKNNKMSENDSLETVYQEIKEENSNLSKKIDILVNRINNLNEEKIRLTEELNYSKENRSCKVEDIKSLKENPTFQQINIFNIQIEGKNFINKSLNN